MMNTKRVYVASSWRNERQPEIVRAIEGAGHEVYDFRNPCMGPGARGKGFHWSEINPEWQSWTPAQFASALNHPVASDGFTSDKVGLDWCDTCVLVMPCGRSAHLELGYAIGKGKLSIILLSDGEPELMYGLADALAHDMHGLLLELLK